MKRSFWSLNLILSLGFLVLLSGCSSPLASSSASTSASTKQTQASASKTQGQTSSSAGQDTGGVQGTGSGQSNAPGTGLMANPSAQMPENLSASWTDDKSDVISPTDGTKPDGLPDGHFQLDMTFPQPVELQSIFVRYSEFGKELRWDWIYDNHLISAGYSLGVFEKGTLLTSGPDAGTKRSGQLSWDLFAAGLNNANGRDTFVFESGENFQIEVHYLTQSGESKVWSTKVKI